MFYKKTNSEHFFPCQRFGAAPANHISTSAVIITHQHDTAIERWPAPILQESKRHRNNNEYCSSQARHPSSLWKEDSIGNINVPQEFRHGAENDTKSQQKRC